MHSSPKISHMHSHSSTSCCQHKADAKFNFPTNALEKICAIALGVFATYVNCNLFVPFFFVGVGIEVYNYVQDKKSFDHAHPASSCAHGFLEQLTGVKLPLTISLAANMAVTICHIDHHASVFVPIIGLSLGAWAGKIISDYGALTHKKINVYCAEKSMAAPPTLSCAN